jgi:hypothetical protein
MLSYLTGTWRGRKLAAETGHLCKDIVNHLIAHGFDAKLPDTAYILKETYAICSLACLRPGMTAKKCGSIVVTAQDILKDWLETVFSQSDRDYDFSSSVEAVIEGLPQYFKEWVRQLTEKHSELIGGSISKWLPAAVSQYLINVGFYVHDRFGREPDNLTTVMNNMVSERLVKFLSSREKRELLASLEKAID